MKERENAVEEDGQSEEGEAPWRNEEHIEEKEWIRKKWSDIRVVLRLANQQRKKLQKHFKCLKLLNVVVNYKYLIVKEKLFYVKIYLIKLQI